jgi:hypothetical protein
MENSKNRFKMMFSIYPLHNQGGKFMKFYGWFLDSGVVPDTALRVFLLFRYRVENHLCFSTRLSYNSIQYALKDLQKMALIKIDPLDKGSKHTVRLTEPTEYNWELIQERLGSRFKNTDTVDKK